MKGKKRSKRGIRLRRALSSIAAPFRGRARPVVITIAVAVGLVIVGNLLWKRFSPQILANAKYQISESTLETNKAPAWIKSKVKAEVIGSSGLSNLRIVDRQVVSKVADAFAVHPWVEKVIRVRKQPEKIVVELKYRRPVSFVEVTHGGNAGLVPVDTHGILLPPADFTAKDVEKYLRISVSNLAMHGSLGTAWRDERVVHAAAIADAWQSDWRRVGLHRIVCPHGLENGAHVYELQTKRGDRIVWGQPPGREIPGEATASEKIAQLVAFAKQNQASRSASEPVQLDVRSGKVRTIPAKTAKRSEQ